MFFRRNYRYLNVLATLLLKVSLEAKFDVRISEQNVLTGFADFLADNDAKLLI